MRTVYILIGAAASGKSTFARELMHEEPGRWVRVNKDDIRSMLHDSVFTFDNEELVRKVQDQIITTALNDGHDLVIDNTHCSAKTRKKLHKLLEAYGDVKVLEKVFSVSVEECIRRNSTRTGAAKVPDEVIKKMCAQQKGLEDCEYYYPKRESQQAEYILDLSKPSCILVDLDGTLAIIHSGRNPYDASTCDQDLPNMPVIECVKAMYKAGHKIIYMSGREDKYREPTERFIAKYVPDVEYELFMRRTADSRKDAIVKQELLTANVFPRYHVLFALDDRNSVIDHYRKALKIPTFQVNYGDF